MGIFLVRKINFQKTKVRFKVNGGIRNSVHLCFMFPLSLSFKLDNKLKRNILELYTGYGKIRKKTKDCETLGDVQGKKKKKKKKG